MCAVGASNYAAGTQFTCFTGTKVQILTPEELQEVVGGQRRSAARYAGTHAHTHAQDKTDAADAGGGCERRGRCGRGLEGRMQQQQQVLSLLALLVQKWGV